MSAIAMLQIGLIASPTQTSGSDRYYFELLRSLRTLGDRVRGVVLGDPRAVENPLDGVDSFAPEGSRTIGRWLGLRRIAPALVRESSVIVSHFAPHAFPILDQLGRRPLIAHFHNPWFLEGRASGANAATLALRYVQERFVYARCSRIIVLSEANARVLERTYGVSRSRIRIVPGGTDLRLFSPAGTRAEARARLGWPIDRPTITIVARLVPAKGVDRAIDAMLAVRAQIPDVRLVVVGDGPQGPALRERVRAAGLHDTVHFAGFQRESVSDLYRAADVVLVPSIAFESFGLVAAEALACGTPVLVTPLLGLPEVVRALEPRLILAGMEPAHIATGLIGALTGSIPLPDNAACAAYARRFDWETVAATIHNVYAEVA